MAAMGARAGQVAYRLSGAQTEERVVEFGVRAASPPTGGGTQGRRTIEAILVGLGLGLALSAAPLTTWAQAVDVPPAWAYPVNPPDFKVPSDDGAPRHVPDSTAAFTLTQARDLFFALDWHPSDHPPLPDIVALGRKPDVMACGVCHRADGPGGPENSGIAGLPAQYIVQQMADSKAARGRPPSLNEFRRS